MFDDTPQKNPTPPSNLPTEPVDMFEGVEKEDAIPGPSALEAGALKKKPYGMGVQTPPADIAGDTAYAVRGPVLGKIIMVLIILIIASGVGYGGWRIYAYFTSANEPVAPKITEPAPVPSPSEPEAPELEPVAEPSPTTTAEVPLSDATTTVGKDLAPLISEGIDTDKDGLDDAREEQLGTDMNRPDTDNDGLSDSDEVMIWRTNPLNPDTDGDTYLDGEEVRNGYSPTGPGKLFNGQGAATSTATTTATTTKPAEEPAI